MGSQENGRFITLEEAQTILRVSVRQVHNYVAQERIRSHKEGKRRMLREDDLLALAVDIGSDQKKDPQAPIEFLPDAGPLVDYNRELKNEWMQLSRYVRSLEAQLAMKQNILEYEQALRQQLADAQARATVLEAEAERLRKQIEESNKPWWKKLFG